MITRKAVVVYLAQDDELIIRTGVQSGKGETEVTISCIMDETSGRVEGLVIDTPYPVDEAPMRGEGGSIYIYSKR